METVEIVSQILIRLPGRFSVELGIDVSSGPEERQRWFLAAILYGGRISGRLAAKTYKVFASRGVYRPEVIVAQGWDRLVTLLDEGGYARYDFKTATKLLAVMGALLESYQGNLENLQARALDPRDLESRLQDLGSGIGPVTVNIFLRELRDIWPKADPHLSALAQQAAAHLSLVSTNLSPPQALAALRNQWRQHPVGGFLFTDLEAALVRLGRDYCRKKSGPVCPLGPWCPKLNCTRKDVAG